MELNSERISYIKYRLETAKEDLESSYLLLQNGKLKSSTNRSYYAIFHSTRVILAIENIDFKHHSGVISYFRKEYIKNNIFDKSLSVIIQKASMIRNSSDYEDFYLVAKEETQEQYENAKFFYETIEKYVKSMIHID